MDDNETRDRAAKHLPPIEDVAARCRVWKRNDELSLNVGHSRVPLTLRQQEIWLTDVGEVGDHQVRGSRCTPHDSPGHGAASAEALRPGRRYRGLIDCVRSDIERALIGCVGQHFANAKLK